MSAANFFENANDYQIPEKTLDEWEEILRPAFSATFQVDDAIKLIRMAREHEKLCDLLQDALNTLLSIQSNRGTHAGSINAKNFHECREASSKIQSELEKLL